MEQIPDQNQAPGTDKPPLQYLPFRSLRELENKVEKLNYIKKMNAALLKTVLDVYNVKYTELFDGAIFLESGAIPEVALEAVAGALNQTKEHLDEVFKELGIITADKTPTGEQHKELYEGLINALNHRNN